MILLPAETLGRNLHHTDSLCRKPFTKHNSLGRKQETADSLGGSQIWRTVSAGSVHWWTRLYPVFKQIVSFRTITVITKGVHIFRNFMVYRCTSVPRTTLEPYKDARDRFELMSVNHSTDFDFNIKVYCVFSLESFHRSDSNVYTGHTIINIKKKITKNYPKYNNVCSYGILF